MELDEQVLKKISETLIRYDVSFPKPGLLHGTMGVVVFFFHCARHTGDISYEDHAMRLLENIQQQILEEHTMGYADGLAGIGAAFEYLAQNDFLEIDTNDILEEFDRAIFRAIIFGDRTDVSFHTGLSGLGRYLFFRVTGDGANNRHIGILDNKMLLIHLTDIFEQSYLSANKKELQDIFFFLYALDQTGIFPSKTGRLITLLSSTDPVALTSRHRMKMEEYYDHTCRDFVSGFPENMQHATVPGLCDGLAGIGLSLLGKIDKRHNTWRSLL